MKIETIDIEPYRAHLSPPMVTSQGTIEEREGFLLRLCDEGGLCGWGEAAPIHWLEGSLESCEQALRGLAAAAGSSSEKLRARHPAISALDTSAACALDTALCDLEAQRAGVSLGEWLLEGQAVVCSRSGGRQTRRPMVAALLAHTSPLSQTTPETLCRQSLNLAARGYRCLKLKVGADTTTRDVERIAALREVFDGSLRLDANGAWTLEQAQAACTQFEGFDILYIEDPLPAPYTGDTSDAEAVKQWQQLAAATRIPLALDAGAEHTTPRASLIEASAVSYVILKLARTGGPRAALDIVGSLRSSGVRCVFTDSVETGVGQRATLQCAAAAQAIAGDRAGFADCDVGLAGAIMIDSINEGGLLAQAPCGNLPGPEPELGGPGLG